MHEDTEQAILLAELVGHIDRPLDDDFFDEQLTLPHVNLSEEQMLLATRNVGEHKYIYVIKVSSQFVKIGYSNPSLKNFTLRLSECKRWVPDAVVFRLYPGWTKLTEKFIHKMLSEEKKEREIFYLSDKTQSILNILDEETDYYPEIDMYWDEENEDSYPIFDDIYPKVTQKYRVTHYGQRFYPLCRDGFVCDDESDWHSATIAEIDQKYASKRSPNP